MWRGKRSGGSGHRLFIRLLVPNMLFLLLPLLVGGVIYNKTLQEMEKEVTAGNMNLLQQSRDILDRRLAEIASIAMQLANDTRIMQFQTVTGPFEGANTYRILDTRKSMYNFGLTNNFIFNYFVLYKNSELVLTESGTYGLEEFFGSFAYKDMDYASWSQLMLGDFHSRMVLPAQQVAVRGNTYLLLTYVQSLGFPGSPQGAIVITIDNREIEKLLGGLELGSGGWAYIIDDKGNAISRISSGESRPEWVDRSDLTGKQGSLIRQAGTDNMIVTYTTSAYNGWTYMVAQPAHIVLEKVLYIKKITFAMALIFLFAGLLIAYLIAYRNSRPLRSIMDTIMEHTGGGASANPDAYRFIRESVSRLINNNQELRDKMERQAPLLKAAMFERLLKGEYRSAAEVPLLLQHVGIEAQGRYVAAAVMKLGGHDGGLDRSALEQLDIKRVMVKDILQREMGSRVYWHDVAEDQIALMFTFDSSEPESVRSGLNRLGERVEEAIQAEMGDAIRFSFGGLHEQLHNVSRSYEEAKQVLEYMNWTGTDGTLRFEQLPGGHNSYYYPSDLEQRIGNLAKAGDYKAVESLLLELRHTNFEERRLSVPMLRLFMNDMWGTIFKLLPQVGIDESDAFERMNAIQTDTSAYRVLMQQYVNLIEMYRQVCDYVNEHKKSQNVQLLGHIVSLLEGSYGKSDLCLDSVAGHMNISSGYLSQFFKEQTGTNFSDYLEHMRMTQAKRLLSGTDRPVFEIAKQVGYSSSNTFCRAFKRINGISTTEFRQLQVDLKAHS